MVVHSCRLQSLIVIYAALDLVLSNLLNVKNFTSIFLATYAQLNATSINLKSNLDILLTMCAGNPMCESLIPTFQHTVSIYDFNSVSSQTFATTYM